MTQIGNNSYNLPVNNGYTQSVPQNPVATPQVNVTTPNGVTPIYQYPTTSIYDPNSKQSTQGVNIYIYNPAGVGGASATANNNYGSPVVNQPLAQQPAPAPAQQPISPQEPIANTPITDDKATKDAKKDLVEITDEYVKSVENYLRSPDEEIRKMGIVELIKRFEEDSSRYDHPALNALLNIALQDPTAHNRLLAMSPIATESAHGDANTAKILDGLTKSTDLRGQEAKMAQESLLKVVHTK